MATEIKHKMEKQTIGDNDIYKPVVSTPLDKFELLDETECYHELNPVNTYTKN